MTSSCLRAQQHITQALSPLLSPANRPPARSRDQLYRELLRSFTICSWSGKPLPLSPIQCARWGWLAIGKDILQCRECKVKLQFICTYQVWQRALYEGVCEEFGAKLQTSHKPACPWAGQPISNDIILGGRGTLFSDKADFISNFATLKKSLKPNSFPLLEIPGDIIKKTWPVLNILLKLTRAEECGLTVGNVTILFLCLLGWHVADDTTLPTLHCRMCQRTIGLWNFRWLSAEQYGECVADRSWGEARSYTLLESPEESSDGSRSRDLSGASEVSLSKTSTSEEPDQPDTPFGNPDVFLPVASYVLFQPKAAPLAAGGAQPLAANGAQPLMADGAQPAALLTEDNFKTPPTRVLRSRSKRGSSESATTPTSYSRKRKSKSSDAGDTSPTTPGRVTRSSARPARKRRRSKQDLQTEELITELMRSSPTKLHLTSARPAPTYLNPAREHRFWCPWVSACPEYHVTGAGGREHVTGGRVSTMDMMDSPGWEALLFYLSTCRVEENAWVTVHNLLEECVVGSWKLH